MFLFKNKQTLKYLYNKFFPKYSYAQHHEDLVIKELLGEVHNLIDIGANDGFSCSNSFLFALSGAKGLMFEPVASTFKKLSFLYKVNNRVICINEGVSDVETSINIVNDNLLSYIPETQDTKQAIILQDFFSKKTSLEKILLKPLSYWLQIYPNFSQCDFVSLDVEGHELSVLKGIDFTKFLTRCWVIETHAQNNFFTWVHRDYEEINHILNQNNYRAVLRNENNTFWLNLDELDSNKLATINNKFPDYQILDF